MKRKPLLSVLTGLALAAGLAGAASAEPRVADRYIPPKPKEGYSYPDCYCTDSSGQRVEVGELACLRIGSREGTSRCEKARNLVIWRHEEEGCAPGV